MANLKKLTLSFDKRDEAWKLKVDKTDHTLKTFDTKADATKGGVLAKVLGEQGGSVRIEKEKGGYQEERTYPRSADPRESKG